MKKMLISLFAALLTAGLVYGQSPIVSVKSISRIGTPDAVDAGYFRIYNPGGTSSVSHVTIVSDSTNLFTVSPTSDTISNDLQLVTITFATGLDAGNYSGNITVTQTNAPVTTRTIPVSLRITRDVSKKLGSLADARIMPTTVTMGEEATQLPLPRDFGDVMIGKIAGTDQNGATYYRMNMWVAGYPEDTDWMSFGTEIYDTVHLSAPLRDTNDTTTVTSYDPVYYGRLLIGKIAAETGAVWAAFGTTTNDWTLMHEATIE
jgi:hypothetical protein